MTSPDYGDLVKKLRKMAESEQAEIIEKFGSSLFVVQDFTAWKAADTIEQQARTIASQVAVYRDADDRAAQLEAKLNSTIEQQARLLSSRDQQIKLQAEKMAFLKRELEACEGALRNSGNMVRDLNDLAKRYENELTRQKHVTATLMAAWPKGVPMPEWEEAAEPDRRGTDTSDHGGMSG